MSWRETLLKGAVIPAHPLALTSGRKLDERRQRALTRYYLAAGAGGVAVGVHTTQFAIHDPQVGLYRPVLVHLIQPHAVFFGYTVGVIELLVGISLLLGLWVRPACILGVIFLLNLTLSAWWDAGHGAPVWRYFGARLDTLPLLLLLIIFFATDAGKFWGLDRLRSSRK